MKRAKSLFNQIISYENVRLAWLKARRHKTSKNVVKNFSKNVNKNLLIVQKNLKSKPAILSSYSQFTIYEPKERLISVVPFIDRVMHHAIMNVLEPVFEKQFIYHTYACRKGKGSHKAIKYAFSKAKNCEFFLKLDVKKYFDNKVYKTVIPRNVRLSEAPSYGMPITEYDPRSKGAKSYTKFAREFLKINEEEKKAKHMM